jgi:hypothetical protein
VPTDVEVRAAAKRLAKAFAPTPLSRWTPESQEWIETTAREILDAAEKVRKP